MMSLTVIGNICNDEMARGLHKNVTELLTTANPNIKKKAIAALTRMIKAVKTNLKLGSWFIRGEYI